ncbi:MAG: formyltetrahydrofolate deformylase [Sneathiella sp.]
MKNVKRCKANGFSDPLAFILLPHSLLLRENIENSTVFICQILEECEEAPMSEQLFILTLSCNDQPGIVSAVTTELTSSKANITESNQFWDQQTGRFFMRIAFTVPQETTQANIEYALEPAIARFDMKTHIVDANRKPKIVVMVSKFDHTLLHLLYQIRVGWLGAEVVAIISNHENSRAQAEIEGIPFHFLPVKKATKAEQELQILALVKETEADLVILARYMQVLSDTLSNRLFGRIINIHHSFLPSFKGAKPYHQAHERGVKLIGATAHYVTPDLDEGPIIEQETERVSHAMSANDFVAAGRDIESRVLARAVKMHLESRVMLNGHKTVVFT